MFAMVFQSLVPFIRARLDRRVIAEGQYHSIMFDHRALDRPASLPCRFECGS
jgi:hypothetical protein